MHEYAEPLPVGITTWDTGHHAIAWGLATGDGATHTGILKKGSSRDALFEAFSLLFTDPTLSAAPIDLYCGDEAFTAALLGNQGAYPRISIQPWTESRPFGLLVRTARRSARDAILETAPELPGQRTDSPDADGQKTRHIVAGTDGSSGFHTRKGAAAVSGWAWITTTGLKSFGTIATSSILAAEVYAISQVVTCTPRSVPLTVLSDSQRALGVIEALRGGATPEDISFSGSRSIREAIRLLHRHLTSDRDMTFEWVRSHDGHPLNEGADRLAVHARRAAQNDLDPQDVIVSRIVDDTLASLKAAAAQDDALAKSA